MINEGIELYRLPDGRLPIRFDRGNAAYYRKIRGTGEVRYPFSIIRYKRLRKPDLTPMQRSEQARERAKKLLAKNPNYYREIGSIGGKKSKRGKNNGSKNRSDEEG